MPSSVDPDEMMKTDSANVTQKTFLGFSSSIETGLGLVGPDRKSGSPKMCIRNVSFKLSINPITSLIK